MDETETKYTNIKFILFKCINSFFIKMLIIVKFSSLFLSFLSFLSSLLIFFCNKSLNLSSKLFAPMLTFFFDLFFFTRIKLFTFNKLILFIMLVCLSISSSSSLLAVANIFISTFVTFSSKEETKVIINKKNKWQEINERKKYLFNFLSPKNVYISLSLVNSSISKILKLDKL